MSRAVEQLRQQAEACLQRGAFRDAARAYRELLSAAPDGADDWYNLAWCLRRNGEFEQALEAYGEALLRNIDQPEEVHLNRAAILSTHLNRDDQAREELQAALDRNPEYAPARLNLGNLFEEAGRRDEALECYRSLQRALPPSDPVHLESLARMAHLDPPGTAEDPRFQTLKAAAARRNIEPQVQADLNLALARCADRLGLYEEAFAAMRTGKRAASAGAPGYQPSRQERLVDALISAFPETATATAASRDGRPRPLFICGMYRSGSTLAERILAAHSHVVAGGELDLLPRLVAQRLQPFPASAAKLASNAASALASEYFDGLARQLPELSPDGLVTDKRPPNFLLLGLVQRLFPEARIIHTVRHPLDTALSIYMQHLDPHQAPYAADLDAIAHYYLQYRRLMAHWRRVFPELIHDLDYDRLVLEPEPAIRQMLEFIGLDWEAACLEFHRRGGAVRTASYWQVRQPLYRAASGRWRRYAHLLEGLRRRLLEGGVPEEELEAGG